MELLYMWIGGYANIYKKGFNFSDEYNFISDDTTIKISKKAKGLIKLFDDQFINIVAIAGENGSGKTSLLSFVENFFLRDAFRMYKDVKLVYKDDVGLLKVFGIKSDNIDCNDDIKFETITELNELQEKVLPLFFSSGIEIVDEPQLRWNSSFVEVTGGELLRDIQNEISKVLLEQMEGIFKYYNWPNISPENLEKFEDDKRWLLKWSNISPAYRNQELKRIAHFICKHNPEEYDFINKWLGVGFNINFIEKHKDVFDDQNELINKLIKVTYNSSFTYTNTNEEYQKHLKQSTICQLFLFIYFCSKKRVRFHKFNMDTKLTELEELESIGDITDYIVRFIETENFHHSGWVINFDKLKELNANLNDQIEKLRVFEYFDNVYYLERNENSLNFINSFFDFWNLQEFAFYFKLNEMSAGEKALLTLLSRIFSITEYNRIDETKTIWLLIDEGELYLHPTWQRSFFFDLHKYLPKFFSNNKIQLFITTHSPFLLSDLPKENVILLEKGESGTGCKVTDMEIIPETFGANIHELLANSFFMKDGVIGRFAEGIINDLFNFLNNEETERKWSKEDAEILIKNIGEPIIREQLYMLFDIKFGSKTEAEHLKYQIEKLEQKLQKIQQNDQDLSQ